VASAPPYFVFVGLGNPGAKYEMTRHNIGARVVEALAKRMGAVWKEDKHLHVKVAKGIMDGILLHLLLPTNYMNRSGLAIKAYLEYLKLDSQKIVVVMDDKHLPFGMIRLRGEGTAGGHNGLKSIEEILGTTHYIRLKMGIGSPTEKSLADYVLENFSSQELTQLEAFVDQGADILQCLLKQSLSRVMTKVNSKVGE
jgi:PTH1 family peptidyl-tRNA hydrolase